MSADLIEPSAADPRQRADPLADRAVARILGAWTDGTPPLSRWDALAATQRALGGWDSNGALDAWQADAATPAPIAQALQDYLREARRLPQWIEPDKVGCAEAVFARIGMLAPTLLACASLLEADVAVDPLAQTLDERVRAAAALQCAALLGGGLLDPNGAGVAQALKLRLAHAIARHLVVRGNPSEALAHGAAIPALRSEGADRWRTLFARGWDLRIKGLPRNQEELAYALLTHHYVFLRSLRRLGLGLNRQEESAWLHAWNVVGHLLGIEESLLPATMKDAEALFARLQQNAVALAGARYAAPGVVRYGTQADPRPALAAELMHALQDEIGSRIRKPWPLLLARRLCGPATAQTLGLDGRAGRSARILFALAMGITCAIDTPARLLAPGLSMRCLGVRILGYRLARRYLIDPARPLDLPEALLRQVDAAVRDWETDPAAPRWVNAIECRFGPQRVLRTGHEAAPC